MNAKFIKWSACAAFLTSLSYAQEKDSLQSNPLKEVVVSDTKFQQEKEKSGKIIEVISAKDLENKKGLSLASILSQVAGVEINGNQSANGKNQGIYIRGGRNRQVAIYIDGVPMNDASNINSEYDLRLLNVNQIEKIEILKGSSSTLYGSGAATGVINITLKKSSKEAIAGNAYFNIGTQNDASKKAIDANDYNQGFSVNGTVKKVTYLTSLNSTETRGFSEAAGENYEMDAFSRVNVMQKIGFVVNDRLRLDFFGNYDKIKTTFDNSFAGYASFSDDLNNASESEQFRIGFTPKYKYNKGEFVINAAASEINRVLKLSNTYSGTVNTYDYASRSVNVDAFNKYTFSDELYLVLGTQFQYFDMNQQDAYTDVVREKAKFSILDPYATLVYNSHFGLNINSGARYNNHSEYGNQLVYNVNPSYTFTKLPLRILSSYSTAYITPSLYQLYGPYGNLELTPEENKTAEVGFEITTLKNKLTFNTVGFYRQEKNTFGFFFDSTTFESFYINNRDKVNAKGIETAVKYVVLKNVTVNANYTFTEVEEQFNRLIPKHKANIGLNYAPNTKWNLNLDYQYVDDRPDAFFDSTTFTREKLNLSSYQLVNINISYNLIKNRLNLFGAVTNIFNEDFQENIGYNTRGRNFKLGLNLGF